MVSINKYKLLRYENAKAIIEMANGFIAYHPYVKDLKAKELEPGETCYEVISAKMLDSETIETTCILFTEDEWRRGARYHYLDIN